MTESQGNNQQEAAGEPMDTNTRTKNSRANDAGFYNQPALPGDKNLNEMANNDGSIKETLDTAFHDIPGYIYSHSIAGSNRAAYYEERSQGKSDAEEEQEYIRTHQPD